MFEAVREFFRRVEDHDAEMAVPSQRGVHLAAAALLFEIVRADGEVRPEELTVMRAGVQGTFGLSAEDTEALMAMAEGESRSAISLFEFTRVVDEAFDEEQKKRIVELLWLVAFADARKDAHEEHLIRQIATLLHVRHPDFIDAKIRARERSGEA
jgi:uncharacterized tellurite resistance protein B-like protein